MTYINPLSRLAEQMSMAGKQYKAVRRRQRSLRPKKKVKRKKFYLDRDYDEHRWLLRYG